MSETLEIRVGEESGITVDGERREKGFVWAVGVGADGMVYSSLVTRDIDRRVPPMYALDALALALMAVINELDAGHLTNSLLAVTLMRLCDEVKPATPETFQ